MDHSLLTPVGTYGWFAMLIIGPLRSGRYWDLLGPVLFAMLIIDFWAVAPLGLNREHSWKETAMLWTLATWPYLVIAWWIGKFARALYREERAKSRLT